MQQTTSRKFSIIESSDPFLPEALNDNTRKIEAALDAHETQTQAAADALDQRVTVLERPRITWGHYKGDGTVGRIIPLPFTPKAAFVINDQLHIIHMAVEGVSSRLPRIALAENGIRLNKIDSTSHESNYSGELFLYMAFC